MTTTIRIDNQLKKECDQIFDDIGISFSGAVNLFLKQVSITRSIPFELRAHTPNAETRKVLDDVISGKEKIHGSFDNADAVMKDIFNA